MAVSRDDKSTVRRRALAIAAVALGIVALGLAAIAVASNPKPGATYAGKVPERIIITGTSHHIGRHLIKFTVSDNGKKVKTYHAHFATNGCQFGAHNVTTDTDIPINDGAFRDKGSYSVGGFTDHVKISGAFVKHGKAADVTFRWTSSQPDCPAAVSMKGRIHVQ